MAVPVPGHEHHAPTDLIATATELGIARAEIASDVPAALTALAADGAATRILILGSLYLAGEVLAANDEPPT